MSTLYNRVILGKRYSIFEIFSDYLILHAL